jgi:hypothetical protein
MSFEHDESLNRKKLPVPQESSNQPKTEPSPKSTPGSETISVHPGVKKRLLQLADSHRPMEERQATAEVLSNQHLLPGHMREEFLNSNLPASNLVERLKKLSANNPEFSQRVKPLLDKLLPLEADVTGTAGGKRIKPITGDEHKARVAGESNASSRAS